MSTCISYFSTLCHNLWHSSTLQHIIAYSSIVWHSMTLQQNWTQSYTHGHTLTHYYTLQYMWTHLNTPQQTSTDSNTLQNTVTRDNDRVQTRHIYGRSRDSLYPYSNSKSSVQCSESGLWLVVFCACESGCLARLLLCKVGKLGGFLSGNTSAV